ncbi:MAG: hypothetical protein WD096_07580 [Actinomycetota bacterium]
MGRRLAVAISVAMLLVPSLAPTVNAAITVSRNDGNDARGPLDLRSVVARHQRGTTRFVIHTHEPFSNAQVDGEIGFFEIDIDTNADRRADYLVGVFYAAGRMRGVLLRANGDLVDRSLAAGRAGGSGVTVEVLERKIGSPDSFDFVIFSVWAGDPCSNRRPCVDSIPNEYPLLRMDYTAPEIRFPAPEPRASSLTHPISFSIKDDRYGTGVGGWEIQVRRWGRTRWATIDEGTKSSATRRIAPGGGSWEVRIVAEDRRGNSAVSQIRRFVMPWDDADPAVSYGGSWVANVGVVDMFAETSHVGQDGATYSITVPTGDRLCVLGGPTTGPDATAAVTIEGVAAGDLLESGGTLVGAAVFCTIDLPASGPAEIVITVTSPEPVTIDGLYVEGRTA